MGYTVIQRFVDLQDHNHRYEVGDVYPRLNVNVSQKRISELASSKNRRGIPLIKKIEEVKKDAVLKENVIPAENEKIEEEEKEEEFGKKGRKKKSKTKKEEM